MPAPLRRRERGTDLDPEMDVEVAADRTDIGLEEPLHAFGATDEVERRDAPHESDREEGAHVEQLGHLERVRTDDRGERQQGGAGSPGGERPA